MTLFGHIFKYKSLAKIILKYKVKFSRRRRLQKRKWMDYILDFSNLPLRELPNNTAGRE